MKNTRFFCVMVAILVFAGVAGWTAPIQVIDQPGTNQHYRYKMRFAEDMKLYIQGGEGKDAILQFEADNSDDNADDGMILFDATDGGFDFRSYSTGAWVDIFTLSSVGVVGLVGNLQIESGDKLSLDGATETNYLQFLTNLKMIGSADLLFDPAGGDVDFDACDIQVDAGKKVSLNGSTETDYIYSSTNVIIGAAADVVLDPAGGQVDVDAADLAVDSGKKVGFNAIAGLAGDFIYLSTDMLFDATADFTFDAGTTINLRPNADTDDYFYFTTVANNPKLVVAGGGNAYFEAAGGYIYFGDGTNQFASIQDMGTTCEIAGSIERIVLAGGERIVNESSDVVIDDGTNTLMTISDGGSVGNVSITGTLTAAGEVDFPIVAQSTESASGISIEASDYGNTLFITNGSTFNVDLPANGATVGSWFRCIITGTDSCDPQFVAATADTLIGPNDADLDSVDFDTGHRIGACVKFISNGTYWVVINEGSTTMTTVD